MMFILWGLTELVNVNWGHYRMASGLNRYSGGTRSDNTLQSTAEANVRWLVNAELIAGPHRAATAHPPSPIRTGLVCIIWLP